jgi:hypothetical protein
MSERISRYEEDALGRRLRQEASATRPEFSAQLHERLRQAIRHELPRPASSYFHTVRPTRWPLWAGTVAAAAVAVVAVVLWQNGVGNRDATVAPTATPEQFVAVVAFGSQMPQRVGGLIDSALSDGRWAYLDHDAQAAVEALIRCLPAELPVAGRYQELAALPVDDP